MVNGNELNEAYQNFFQPFVERITRLPSKNFILLLGHGLEIVVFSKKGFLSQEKNHGSHSVGLWLCWMRPSCHPELVGSVGNVGPDYDPGKWPVFVGITKIRSTINCQMFAFS